MSRVNEISRNLELSASAKRTGHLDKFIQAKEFKDKKAENASIGIRYGIRWLVFESIYGSDNCYIVIVEERERKQGSGSSQARPEIMSQRESVGPHLVFTAIMEPVWQYFCYSEPQQTNPSIYRR